MACLAGGAQLHSRENLESIGGRIDTSTLAEDTVTTFRTQLSGKSVVFEATPSSGPRSPAIWTGCGSSVCGGPAATSRSRCSSRNMWLHGRRYGKLGRRAVRLDLVHGRADAGLHGGGVSGLIGLYLLDAPSAWTRVPPALDLSRRRLPVRHGDVVRARSVDGAARVAAGHPLSGCDLAGDHHLQRRSRADRRAADEWPWSAQGSR